MHAIVFISVCTVMGAVVGALLLWRDWTVRRANDQLTKDLEAATRIRERVKGVGMPGRRK